MSTLHHSAARGLAGIAGSVVMGAVVLSLTVASVAAQAAPTSSPALQQACLGGSPSLQLANPNPGDVLSTGDYIVSGTAFETAGAPGEGVSRVDLFLGHREDGGIFLGSVIPGQKDSTFTAGSQLALSGFTLTTTLPSWANGGHDFVAYAYSATNGQETSESVPVFIGAPPAATPQTSTSPMLVPLVSTTIRTACATPAELAPTTAPIAQATPSTIAPPSVGTAIQQAPVLQLANPSAGDVVQTGDVIIEGMAFDPAATQGAGVDQVQLFLGDRDLGGLFLGSAVPGQFKGFSIRATVPAGINGSHWLFAYAHSSVTGKDVSVSVPVYIGAAPSPTPRPS